MTRAPNRKLRVLLFMNDIGPGAAAVPLDAFERCRDEVQLFTVTMGGQGRGLLEDRYRRLGPLYFVDKWDQAPTRRIRRRLTSLLLGRVIARFSPDILYVNTASALAGVGLVPLPSVPVLLHVHELFSYLEPILRRPEGSRLRDWPTRYIAVSGAVRQMLVERVGVREDRVVVIHPWIPDDALTRPPLATASAADGGKLIVGGAGRMDWRKGIDLWLEVAGALKDRLPPGSVEFRWVGMDDGEAGATARFHARRLGVEQLIRFVPWTPRPLDEYAAFGLFIMTSWEDACPLVVLENMALGKPVLCFAGGGGAVEEVGDAGVVIPGFDVHLMAGAAARLAVDRAARTALGRAARQRVERLFAGSVQAPKLLDALREAAGIRRSGVGSRARAF